MGTISVELSNDKAYTAFSIKLILPTGINYVSAAKGERMAESHSMSGNASMVTCMSSSNEVFTGSSGELFTITVSANGELEVGTVLTATLTEVNFSTTSGEETLNNVNFNITIGETDDPRTILDENSTTAPKSSDGVVAVCLNRTIKGGIWSTIVLPFDATGEQVKAAFGSDVELAEFKAWSSEEDDEGAIVGINVEFASVDADEGIAANTPMIIKTGSDVTTATFDGVTIDPEEEPAVQVGKRASERAYFYGTYVSMKVPEENVFLKDNMFWYSTGNTTIKGYRGFFAFRDVLDAYYDVADVRFNFFLDNVETSIDGLKDGKVNKEEQEIYNLAGQRIRRAQHGVNIINGNKIVKR